MILGVESNSYTSFVNFLIDSVNDRATGFKTFLGTEEGKAVVY